jgi:hypothetical protein
MKLILFLSFVMSLSSFAQTGRSYLSATGSSGGGGMQVNNLTKAVDPNAPNHLDRKYFFQSMAKPENNIIYPKDNGYLPIEEFKPSDLSKASNNHRNLETEKKKETEYILRGLAGAGFSIRTWQNLGQHKGRPDKFDCMRYNLAYKAMMKDHNANQNPLKILRDNYNKYKISWMGNHEEYIETNKRPGNTHEYIANYEQYANRGAVYDTYDIMVNESYDLDETMRFIISKLQYRSSRSRKFEVLQSIQWACDNDIISTALVTNLNITRTVVQELDPEIKKRRDEYGCNANFYKKRISELQSVIKPSAVIPAESKFFKSYKMEGMDKTISNLNPHFIRAWLGYFKKGLKKEGIQLGDYFKELKYARASIDVLYCVNNIQKKDPLIVDFDYLLKKSAKDVKLNSCDLERVAEKDAVFRQRTEEIGNLYDSLPTTAQIETVHHDKSEAQIEGLAASEILSKVGKDFIDDAVKNLVVVSYLYNIPPEEYRDYNFKCDKLFKSATSEYCANFKRYVKFRIRKELDTTYKKLEADPNKKPLLNCNSAAPGIINQRTIDEYVSLFSEENLSFETPLPKTGKMLSSTGVSKYNEQVTIAKYKKIEELMGDKSRAPLIPLMYTDAFLDSITATGINPKTIYSDKYSQTYYQGVSVHLRSPSCESLVHSLNSSLTRNIAFIANPDNKKRGRFFEWGTKNTAVGSEMLKMTVQNLKEEPIKTIIGILSPVYSAAAGNQNSLLYTSAEARTKVENVYNPLPALQNDPHGYINHLGQLLKHNEYDGEGNKVRKKYLKEFAGNNLLICSLYQKMSYDEYILDPYKERYMKFFTGVVKTVAILVTAVSWIIPPAGAAVSFALTATSLGLTAAYHAYKLDMYYATRDEYAVDFDVKMKLCVQKATKEYKKVDVETLKSSCLKIVKYREKMAEYTKKIKKQWQDAALDAAVYAVYTFRSFKHIGHHKDQTGWIGKLSDFVKRSKNNLKNINGKQMINILKTGAKNTPRKLANLIKNTWSKTFRKQTYKDFAHTFSYKVQHGMEHDAAYYVTKRIKTSYYASMVTKIGYLAYFGGDVNRATLILMKYEDELERVTKGKSNKTGKSEDELIAEMSEDEVASIMDIQKKEVDDLSDEDVFAQLNEYMQGADFEAMVKNGVFALEESAEEDKKG